MDRRIPGPALLFCPGDRPERFEKALARADGVVLDLEDGVLPEAKESARGAVAAALATLDPERTVIRINATDSEYFGADLEALREVAEPIVMLPKAADPAMVERVAPLPVIAICETAAGVVNAAAVAAAANCIGLLWGSEDLMVSLGGRTSRLPDGGMNEVSRQARIQVLLAAKACGRAAIDRVYLDIRDRGLAEEAAEAAALGFDAKASIHPAQAGPIRESFAPRPDEIAWARAVLGVAAEGGEEGAFLVAGQMIDAPLLAQAKQIEAADAARKGIAT